jgi:error-prone DNA polymerase
MVNILCSQGVWQRHRKLAQTASAMVIRGQVQNATGAVTVVADRLSKLDMRVASRSRDFR